jgi:hypothetical protein
MTHAGKWNMRNSDEGGRARAGYVGGAPTLSAELPDVQD